MLEGRLCCRFRVGWNRDRKGIYVCVREGGGVCRDRKIVVCEGMRERVRKRALCQRKENGCLRECDYKETRVHVEHKAGK